MKPQPADLKRKLLFLPALMAIVLFVTSCTIDMHSGKSNFYSKRIIKKQTDRQYSMRIKVNHANIRLNEVMEIVAVESVSNEQAMSVPVDLASLQTIVPGALPVIPKVTLPVRVPVALANESYYDQEMYIHKALNKSRGADIHLKSSFVPFKAENVSVTDDDNLPMVKDGGGMSIISFLSGILGFFVAGIPLGFVAIIFGSLSIGKHKKLKGLAIAGMILGIIDIIGALMVLSSL